MAITHPRRALFLIGLTLIAIAAERLVNMLWIGRPLESFTTRAVVYQVCAAAGITALIIAALLTRRR